MEALLIILGLCYLSLPFIALVMAWIAKNRSNEMQVKLQQQAELLAKQDEKLLWLYYELQKLQTPTSQSEASAQTETPAQDNNAQTLPVTSTTMAPVAPVAPATTPEPSVSLPPVRQTAAPIQTTSSMHKQPATTVSATASATASATISANVSATAAPDAQATQNVSPSSAPDQASAAPRAAPATPAWLQAIRAWLFGGNLVAKIGLLILFFGMGFLLKYASEQFNTPIEVRLALMAAADIAFFAWGWKIRHSRPGIALPVQGAALAILMLITFAAFRIYHVLPAGLAFFILFALTAYTCILAVLQNAMWLALFGISGGFLVPILTSTGGGSHIGLFSYYLLLNAGILAIALKRAWRPLNLVGLGFTFVIGSAWGILRYEAQDYASVQGFLLAFFLFYVAIAILYAHIQPPKLKGLVDGTLIFGTPMLGFGLQYALVKPYAYGLAFSALALGLFYTVLASLLWRRAQAHAQPEQRLLVEALLALGVVFGTLTIPLALDGRWTSAAWALEGAGIVWVGLRQRRPLTWGFGLLVQVGAWIAFTFSLSETSSGQALQQNLWLGFLLLAGTALAIANQLRQQTMKPEAGINAAWAKVAAAFLVIASLWLVGGAWVEVFLRNSGTSLANWLVVSSLLIVILLSWLAHIWQWSMASSLAYALQWITGVVLLLVFINDWQVFDWSREISLWQGPWLSSMLLSLGAAASALALYRAQSTRMANSMLFWAAIWWYTCSLPALASGLIGPLAALQNWLGITSGDGAALLYCLSLTGSGMLGSWLAQRLVWPNLRWVAMPVWLGLSLLSVFILGQLMFDSGLPERAAWFCWAVLWIGNEFLLAEWPRKQWAIQLWALKFLHLLRTASPWCMVWAVGNYWLQIWLALPESEALLSDGQAWFGSGSWERYLPAWLMMGLLAVLYQRASSARWPSAPLQTWYLGRLLPLGVLWSLWLVTYWNLTQNGSMAPLPYLPLLNPLDLSTVFAVLLAIYGWRMQSRFGQAMDGWQRLQAAVSIHTRHLLLAIVSFVWGNLILLRTLAQYCDITYQFSPMFDSQLVQVVLALVWSVSALILMRYAAQRAMRDYWLIGAGLLGLVVVKLFLVDLSNAGGIERVISFLGVGIFMVAIGYLAPFPGHKEDKEKTS